MEQAQLKALFDSLTLEEKMGQLLQVTSQYFEKEGIITGPENYIGYSEDEINSAGSILGGSGAALLRKIQDAYIKKHPHHIPLLFMADVINGYRTLFPIPLAQGCTFNPELSEKAASVSAREAAAAGLHLTFSPMVDLARDPRWGRVMESTGEDTYLNECFAGAIVEGYQGRGSLKEKGRIAACVKHFAGYGAPIGGRDYNTVELSERTLRDSYLPSYKAAVDAGCAMAMTSFNTLDRVPSSANKKLLRGILREEMGFKGVVISDWAAIEELLSHGLAGDKKEASRLALEAGVDIDMMTSCYSKSLKSLIEENKDYEALVDEAAYRILELKNELGLFENPYKDGNAEDESRILLCEEHRKLAKAVASESMVLLKNDGILPLKKEGQKTAFIGPYVHSPFLIGSWSIFGKEADTVTLAQGVKGLGVENATFARGCPALDTLDGLRLSPEAIAFETEGVDREALLVEALLNAREADVVVMAVGEHQAHSGEAVSRAELGIPQIQLELFRKIYEVNANIVVLLFGGRPLEIKELTEKAKAVLKVWIPGTEGGNAIAEMVYGKTNPSGKLAMSIPYSVGQVPVFYSDFRTGRPYAGNEGKGTYFSKYIDIPNEPLYPFGYGLSYTRFEISSVSLSAGELTRDGSLKAHVTVKNTGEVLGKEVVQMYIQDICASVARPLRELKGFIKVELAPGEEKSLEFTITEDMLRFHDIHMAYTSEPGAFAVYIGNSSTTQNRGEFNLIQLKL